MLSKSCLRRWTTLYDLLTYSEHDVFQRDSTKIQIIASIVTWQVKEYKIVSEPSLLTGFQLAGWLTGWLCCQPRFQFHEVKAAGWYPERFVNEAARRPSRSAKTMESGERWMDGIPMF